MPNTNFSMIARATPYEVAKALANRDDAVKPYKPVEIPQMKYPQLELTPTAVWALVRGFAP